MATIRSPLASPSPAGATLPSLACRALAGAVSLSHLRKRLSILIYHRVLPQPDPLFPAEPDALRFDQQLGYLKQAFNIIPLGEAVRGLRHNCLPPRAACITFDDGYADNAEVALPILKLHGVSACFFVATGFLNGGRMWNDTVIELVRHAPDHIDLDSLKLGQFTLDSIPKRQAAIAALLGALKYLPPDARQAQVDAIGALLGVAVRRDLMMSDEQVRRLHRAGMEIGGHTVNHPIVARLPPSAARTEIADGKYALEQLLGEPIRLFAYPNGKPGQDYQAEHVAMVRGMGFEAAVSTAWGAARSGSDLFQLPRFTPWDRTPLRFTLRMMRNLARNGETV
ncbi:MAG TPA: polysaccharide deacetylase family protein [Telluria sp.]|nr:polysaccharide deacetylase family protein [Telluria sp.]